jgi:hypothetical protein
MQTNNTLFLASPKFAKMEDTELQKVQLTAKPRDMLSTESKLIFNRYMLSVDSDGTLHLIQKDQGQKLKPVTVSSNNTQQEYLEQQACSAYIALICQPEASYNLLVAAQHKNPTEDNVRTLNKQLE